MKRKDIDDAYKWDLTKIYENDSDLIKDMELFKKNINNLEKYKGKILNSAKNLLNFIEEENKLDRLLSKISTYISLKHDEDTSDPIYQDLSMQLDNIYTKYAENTSFIQPEMLASPYSLIEKYIKEENKLKEYEYNLKTLYRYKKHTLTEKEEKLLSILSPALTTTHEIFESLTDTDMKFGKILVDGREEELNESNYSSFVEHKNKNVRRDAWTRIHETYGNYKTTLATNYSKYVNTNVALANIYNYNSALESSLYSDNIDKSIYTNLINIINKNLNVLHKYYKLQKDTMKEKEFHIYDTYAPMVEEDDTTYSFEEAKDIVKKALLPLGEDYVKDLDKAFTDKWIDVYHNDAKRSGAYSGGCYDTNPYVLLNYEGKYNDVSTLAHELGHSMHSFYSKKNNPYHLSGYKIFVAEVASTVNELLLAHYMLKESKNKKEKKAILNKLMNLFKSTIYRQTMFAEFEYNTHERVENKETLTSKYLTDSYLELVKKYFGEEVIIDDVIKYEYSRIPHFYYDFYVYKYAIGLSCAAKIVTDILNNKPNALEKYRKFLTLGGSMDPTDELLVAGVDVKKEDLYLAAISMFEGYINEFKKIKEEELE